MSSTVYKEGIVAYFQSILVDTFRTTSPQMLHRNGFPVCASCGIGGIRPPWFVSLVRNDVNVAIEAAFGDFVVRKVGFCGLMSSMLGAAQMFLSQSHGKEFRRQQQFAGNRLQL